MSGLGASAADRDASSGGGRGASSDGLPIPVGPAHFDLNRISLSAFVLIVTVGAFKVATIVADLDACWIDARGIS
jgi:hypothetical protein